MSGGGGGAQGQGQEEHGAVISSIVANIQFQLSQPRQKERRSIVLLSTGGLNPVHRGHLSMLLQAAEGIEAALGTPGRVHGHPEHTPFAHIAGAILSPSSDTYLASKRQDPHFEGGGRLELVKSSVRHAGHGTWLFPDRWEIDQDDFLNFPEVRRGLIRRLQAAVHDRLGEEMIDRGHALEVVYVCGSDVADKCGLWGKDWVTVVGRGGDENLLKNSRAKSASSQFRARCLPGNSADLLTSSTKVRELTDALRAAKIDEREFRKQAALLVYPEVTERLISAVKGPGPPSASGKGGK